MEKTRDFERGNCVCYEFCPMLRREGRKQPLPRHSPVEGMVHTASAHKSALHGKPFLFLWK